MIQGQHLLKQLLFDLFSIFYDFASSQQFISIFRCVKFLILLVCLAHDRQ